MAGGFGAFLAHSKVVSFIRDVHFPCSRDDLISAAEDNDAPQDVLEMLHLLPDREFNSLTDVTQSIKKP